MIQYKVIEKYLSNMFVALLGDQAESFGFSTDSNVRCIADRQNKSPMPTAATVLYFRIDDYDNWRVQRYGRGTITYDAQGNEYIGEQRTFKCVVNILSKNLGDAFDATRFLIANLQNNRYNTYVSDNGRLLGIEQIYKMKNLSDLENGTWTERIQFEIQMNFREAIEVKDTQMFVKKPETPADLALSVDMNINLEK